MNNKPVRRVQRNVAPQLAVDLRAEVYVNNNYKLFFEEHFGESYSL
jgi:hypothetical protein